MPATATSATRKTPAQVQADIQQRAGVARQTAQSANVFYTSFPNDPRVPQARKLESMSLLRGVLATDADRGQVALQTASAYRGDRTIPGKDRLEVAVMMERLQYELRQNGRALSSDPAEHERTADRLRTEFGDLPEVYGFYLAVVNTADRETANRVARKILLQPAPASAKIEAQLTIDRYSLLGKKVDAVFTTLEGEPVALSTPGKPTIVYLWSGDARVNDLNRLKGHSSIVPHDARWVYVALHSGVGATLAARSLAPFPGSYCFDAAPSAGVVGKLFKNQHLPYVYVFDRGGNLASYGRPDELPALLTNAGL